MNLFKKIVLLTLLASSFNANALCMGAIAVDCGTDIDIDVFVSEFGHSEVGQDIETFKKGGIPVFEGSNDEVAQRLKRYEEHIAMYKKVLNLTKPEN